MRLRPRILVASLIALGASIALAGQRLPIQIVQATQIGKTMWEPGDTSSGGNGQPVDGIQGSSREMLAVHVHAHLSIFVKGEQMAVPYGIGIVAPFQVDRGFVGMGRGIYWLHTHDATGVIHIESPDDRTYTLGQFFHIWGRTLSATDVAGMKGPVKAFVDGKPRAGDPGAIALATHEQITLEVGTPVVTPPVYAFPAGL